VAKPELGTKRTCPECAVKFYDLGKNPCVCPKCENTFEPEILLKSKRRPDEIAAEEAQAAAEAKAAEEEKAKAAKEGQTEGTETPDENSDDIEVVSLEDIIEDDDDSDSDSDGDDTLIVIDDDEEDDVSGIIDTEIIKPVE
jgi:uncharacterized protein (TIGR02300 family)